MSFLSRSRTYAPTPRRMSDVVRDACAVEQFAPRTRRFDGHRFIVGACLLAGLVVLLVIFLEHL